MIAAHAFPAVGICELDEIRQALGIAVRQTIPMEELLPLPHHAHVFVVEDENLDRQIELHGGRAFLNIHQDRGVTCNVDHQRFGMRELHTNSCWQTITHRSKPTRCHPAVRLLEVHELRGPHLMLADFSGDVGVAVLCQRLQPFERILRHDNVF